MGRARGHMDAEDARVHKKEAREAEVIAGATTATTASAEEVDPSPKEETEKDPPRTDSRPSRADKRDQRREATKRPALTSLNTSLTQALYLVQKEEYLNSTPPRMKLDPQFRDTRQYCRYHRNHDHHTDDCRVLQRDIEDLIQKGFLKRLISRQDRGEPSPGKSDRRSRSRSPRPQHQQDKQPAETDNQGVINTISGGPAAGGMSNNARKKYVRRVLDVNLCEKKPRTDQLISFSNADLKGIEMPRDDSLIISAEINGFRVERILVNTGSSTDILFIDAFNQMGIDKSKLQPCRGPLIGFTGHSLLPEGMITLPLMIGEYPR